MHYTPYKDVSNKYLGINYVFKRIDISQYGAKLTNDFLLSSMVVVADGFYESSNTAVSGHLCHANKERLEKASQWPIFGMTLEINADSVKDFELGWSKGNINTILEHEGHTIKNPIALSNVALDVQTCESVVGVYRPGDLFNITPTSGHFPAAQPAPDAKRAILLEPFRQNNTFGYIFLNF